MVVNHMTHSSKSLEQTQNAMQSRYKSKLILIKLEWWSIIGENYWLPFILQHRGPLISIATNPFWPFVGTICDGCHVFLQYYSWHICGCPLQPCRHPLSNYVRILPHHLFPNISLRLGSLQLAVNTINQWSVIVNILDCFCTIPSISTIHTKNLVGFCSCPQPMYTCWRLGFTTNWHYSWPCKQFLLEL